MTDRSEDRADRSEDRAERADRWAAVITGLDPAATLTAATPLTGGLSAETTRLDYVDGNGRHHRVVARRGGTPLPGALSPAHQHRLLEVLHRQGAAVPRPIAFCGDPDPVSIVAYVDGRPRFRPLDPLATARAMAEILHGIHRIGRDAVAGLGLPQRRRAVHQRLSRPTPTPLHEAMFTHRGQLDAGVDVLLHGDFWPGNLLWPGDPIPDPTAVAESPTMVIDWEDAAIGPAASDVAIARLDLVWIYGDDAAAAFTEQYQRRSPLDPRTLAFWDLVAALRPVGVLSAWSTIWAELGREDITKATMIADLHRFTENALARLQPVR